MDKKNTIIGVLLIAAAFAVMLLQPKPTPPPAPATPPAAQPAAPAGTAPAQSPATPAGTATTPATAPAPTGIFATAAQPNANATITTLQNEFIAVHFSNFGGAVRDVAFKKYPAVLGQNASYVFNQIHEDPLLALGDFPGLGHRARYEIVDQSATHVSFRVVLDGKLEVTRTYHFTDPDKKGGDPYRLHHETTFRNLTDATFPLPRPTLSLGTATLVNDQDTGQYLSVTSFDGDSTVFTERTELEGGGFFSSAPPKSVLEKPGNIVWAGVKNQFFASVYTPEKPGVGIVIRRIELAPFAVSQRPHVGLTGNARHDLPALAAGQSARLAGYLYVGPQEYRRLAKFEHAEDRVLPYTQYFFNRIFLSHYVAPFLNVLMNFTHGFTGNWGVAIILMTLLLKVVSLPFTLAASKSAKRMAKIQPDLQAIREKYKDNPQKQQQATMELFKAKKINPLGGCLPVLVTMPLFIGFFSMLQCTAELRFQPFLWATDLSAPDTIAHLFGLPINIMPVLMGATMVIQMRLTPSPSVDKAQATMMKIMPYIFTLFCYTFSCALSLYSFINGLFTIGQQLVINKMKDPDETPAVTVGPGGKVTKNVTPKK
jgi:YidC/Oxa1 family membrane protein insertase